MPNPTMCVHGFPLGCCAGCSLGVLPGNPGSDWTEQDERMMRTYAEIPDTELSDWPQSSDMPHRLAREILRLRAGNEYLAERVEAFEAQQSALLGAKTVGRAEWECKCGAMVYEDNDGKSRVCWTGRLHTCRSPEVEEAGEAPEPFVVRHYTDDERPSIKGNGFDGLTIGEDRQDAEDFVAWLNARLRVPSRFIGREDKTNG